MIGPYCVIFVSVGLALGGLIVGSAAVFVIHKCTAQWFRRVRHLSVRDRRDDVWRAIPVYPISSWWYVARY